MEELINGIKEAKSVVITGSVFSITTSDFDVDNDCSKIYLTDVRGNEIFINVNKVVQVETDSSEKRYKISDEVNNTEIFIDLF